jgi:hypothetical protein
MIALEVYQTHISKKYVLLHPDELTLHLETAESEVLAVNRKSVSRVAGTSENMKGNGESDGKTDNIE